MKPPPCPDEELFLKNEKFKGWSDPKDGSNEMSGWGHFNSGTYGMRKSSSYTEAGYIGKKFTSGRIKDADQRPFSI